jgi:hypothetical protein
MTIIHKTIINESGYKVFIVADKIFASTLSVVNTFTTTSKVLPPSSVGH